MRIEIKPLSVNKAWQGRRFKTKEYKDYQEEVLLLLPKINICKKSKLKLDLVFGFSNKMSDIDNPLKPILDILQKKYGFDDRNIYELSVRKEIVKKKEDFIQFNIEYL
jgi:Holliday junction resolvase RusA-like endonuclease